MARRWLPAAFLAAAVCASSTARRREGDAELCGPATLRDTSKGRATTMSRRKGAGSRARGRYVPAPWERQWALEIGWLESDAIDALGAVTWDKGCAHILTEVDKVRRWLTWIERRADGRSPPGDGEVLSGWADPGGCDGWAPIEPLVSHLRHPFFHCVGPHKDTFELMFSKAYIALPRAAEVGADAPGVRRFFFDAGASVYDECWWGCTKWFVDSRGLRRGIFSFSRKGHPRSTRGAGTARTALSSTGLWGGRRPRSTTPSSGTPCPRSSSPGSRTLTRR